MKVSSADESAQLSRSCQSSICSAQCSECFRALVTSRALTVRSVTTEGNILFEGSFESGDHI